MSHDFKSGVVADGSHDTVVASDLGPVALILVPTRELAMKIETHLSAVARHTKIKVHT